MVFLSLFLSLLVAFFAKKETKVISMFFVDIVVFFLSQYGKKKDIQLLRIINKH